MRRLSRQSNKFLIITLLVVMVLSAITTLIYLQRATDKSTSTRTPTKDIQSDPLPKADIRLRFAAMGDMLAHDTIIANAKTDDGYDFGAYFQKIRSLYEDADVVFCNQEGLSSGPAYGISGYPSFNAPTEFATGLKNGAGCNLINLANNHMGDKGAAATSATVDLWRQLDPLAVSGANKSAADQQRVRFTEVDGVKIGFVSFADFNNNAATPAYSVNLYHDDALVRKLIGEARNKADLIIVSMHWGTESSAAVDAEQQAQVKLLASLGVDIIIGTGPHVLQKVETVDRPNGGKMVVWYSLGNMLSSQLNTPELFSGIARFEVVKPANGKIRVENLSFLPTYMHYEWTAAEKAGGNLSSRRNAMIYPLSDAAGPLSRSQLDTTVEAQRQYIIDTLGPEVSVK